MNFKQKCVIRILIFVARIMADEEWRKEIEQIGNHIQHGDGGVLSDRKVAEIARSSN